MVVRKSSSNLRKSPYFMLLESLWSKLSWKVVCVCGTPPVYLLRQLIPPLFSFFSLFFISFLFLDFCILHLVSFLLQKKKNWFFFLTMLNSSPFISNYLLNKKSEIIFAISTSTQRWVEMFSYSTKNENLIIS